jgi:hypothetical protein
LAFFAGILGFPPVLGPQRVPGLLKEGYERGHRGASRFLTGSGARP